MINAEIAEHAEKSTHGVTESRRSDGGGRGWTAGLSAGRAKRGSTRGVTTLTGRDRQQCLLRPISASPCLRAKFFSAFPAIPALIFSPRAQHTPRASRDHV